MKTVPINDLLKDVKAPKLKEKDIQRQIKEYLEWKGWFVAVTSTPAMTAATKGLPDLIAVKALLILPDGVPAYVQARTVWIEVKGPKGVMSDAQKDFQANIEAQGGEYLVARSIENVQSYLEEAK